MVELVIVCLHQNHGHLVKDLTMGNREVILKVNPRQVKCNNCKKPFSETLSFVAKYQGFTNRYAVIITEQVIHSDVNNVAKNNGLTKVEVWSRVMFIAESIMPINVEQLKRLDRDEISLVKGQDKLIVVLVYLDTHKLVGLVSSRTQSEIEKVMRQWGEVEIVLRPLEKKGFVQLPKRWVVERTFGWLNWCRRLSSYYQRLPATSETLIYIATIRIMVRGLA